MSKKKQATDEMLKEVLEKEKEASEAQPEPQESFNFVEAKKKLMLRVHVGKARVIVHSLTAIQEEYQRVRAGHLPNSEVFLNCLQNLSEIANTLMLKELEADGITMEELQQAIMNYGKPNPPDNPVQESSNSISSSEPPVVVPSSPSPVEEPLKDPSPTDPQPSNE